MADEKYILDKEENKRFLRNSSKDLLDFGRRFPSPGGSSYYLDSSGNPVKERDRETWITSRMAHVYSIGSMMGYEGAVELAEAGIRGLVRELRDRENGGWYAGLTEGNEIVPGKPCYAHAFVILAATSAFLAGVQGADELLEEALRVFDERFWDENDGMTYDSWDTGFSSPEDYRGLNSNMHTVEAFLAAADALGDDKYRVRAGRIIKRTVGIAEKFDYRLPEHYTGEWEPVPDMNQECPDDPFKPYGATPGHGIEWARLILQWSLSSYKTNKDHDRDHYINAACRLYDRAVSEGWNSDGAEGIVYTTDWDGRPVVRDRMHWTLAEAINTSAVLYRVTGDTGYADDYAAFMCYLDGKVMDHEKGSWFHQLDEKNRLKETVWPGKPDIYHAFQAMNIPYLDPALSIAKAVFDRK